MAETLEPIRLPPAPDGWHILRTVVLTDGSLGLLYADVDLAEAWRRQLAGDVLVVAGEMRSRPLEAAAVARGLLRCWDGREIVSEFQFPLETPFPLLDRFQDGRWLVVGARTDAQPNARVLTHDGALVSRFMLGDGIEHLGIDSDDQIWVGWFDEGIFGNDEWKGDWEWPPSSQGIGCFSPDGAPHTPILFPESAGMIAGCYAMNVGAEGSWFVPYVDFPILNLARERPIRWWRGGLSGARAIAVGASHALITGGYGQEANLLRFVRLEGEGDGALAEVLATWQLPLRERQPPTGENPEVSAHFIWEQPTLLSGRGDTIHLLQDEAWFQWRVPEAIEAAKAR